ncbi:MAG TPA: hypothetical protein VGR53_01610 [Nitrososphaerales archaeon]|nr:hypothetical protein [Nitrososphaerales archaeon]
MNRYVVVWGILVLGSGFAMHLLLVALGTETFFMAASYLPPAQTASYATILAGLLLVAFGLVFRRPGYFAIESSRASKYFGRLALINALAAAIFAFPMLIPSLEFPILLTEWPGIYIVIAYSYFIFVGVIGMLGWGVVYHLLPALFSRDIVDGRSVIVQLVLIEVGTYTLSSVLFAAGFIGATLVHDGKFGSSIVGAAMEFADIPSALAIFVIIVSVFLGTLNIMTGKRTASQC